MKKISKIIISCIVLFISFSCINTTYGVNNSNIGNSITYIANNNEYQPSEWKDGFRYGDNFIQIGSQIDENSLTTLNDKDLKRTSSAMFKAFATIGTALSAIVGVILGISFMLASAEDKAQIKEKMIPYIVGCVIIFGAFGIWRVVIQILEGLN